MSYEASFYCEIIGMDVFGDSPTFTMLNIYLKGKEKGFKEDSFAASKLYTNMEMLKAAGDFLFSIFDASQGQIFKDLVAKNKSFRLGISAYIGNYKVRVLCFDCELVQAMVTATQYGTAQVYEVKFKDALINQMDLTPAPKNRRRGIFPIITPFPWGGFRTDDW